MTNIPTVLTNKIWGLKRHWLDRVLFLLGRTKLISLFANDHNLPERNRGRREGCFSHASGSNHRDSHWSVDVWDTPSSWQIWAHRWSHQSHHGQRDWTPEGFKMALIIECSYNSTSNVAISMRNNWMRLWNIVTQIEMKWLVIISIKVLLFGHILQLKVIHLL